MPPPTAANAPLDAHAAPVAAHSRLTTVLLNVAHAIDHLVLLIFATASRDCRRLRVLPLEDLMPFAAGAFLLFGLARCLRDGWATTGPPRDDAGVPVRHRRIVPARRDDAECLAARRRVDAHGAFASIYHPVGIPMLVQNTSRRAK